MDELAGDLRLGLRGLRGLINWLGGRPDQLRGEGMRWGLGCDVR